MKIKFDDAPTKYSIGLIKNNGWGFDAWAQTENIDIAKQIKEELAKKYRYEFTVIKQSSTVEEVIF